MKAFQYEEKESQANKDMDEVNKENVRINPEKAGSQSIAPPPQPLSQSSATKDLRDCPQTPLGRLPLSELLASGEDTSRQHLNLTPIERVLWDNSPMSSSPGTAARKKRKRAHSSSPASSSQNETFNYFAGAKPAVDLHTLQKSLKTPKADPADDLWSRYSLNTVSVDRRPPTAPGFAHLTQSSSPQTPATHLQREAGSLRRALSCVEWPTSVAKRRKIHHSSSQGDSGRGPIGLIERSKVSRVSRLIEKIQDGLSKPTARHDDETSSEPTTSPVAKADKFPPRETTFDYRESKLVIDGVANVLSQTAVAPKENAPQPLILSANEIADVENDGRSSDFADDDLDLEMLETMGEETVSGRSDEAILRAFKSDHTGNDSAPAAIGVAKDTKMDDSRNLSPSASARSDEYSDVPFPLNVSSSTIPAAPQTHDEFDEDDTEVSTADLEAMFARYDSQPPQAQAQRDQNNEKEEGKFDGQEKVNIKLAPGPGKNTSSAEKVNVQILSDDDEFGDDSDFEQIAVEYAGETQKQQVSQPQSSVCTLKSGSSI